MRWGRAHPYTYSKPFCRRWFNGNNQDRGDGNRKRARPPYGMGSNTISNKKNNKKQNIGKVTNLQENVAVYLHMLAKPKLMCIFKPLRKMTRAAPPPPLCVGMGVLQNIEWGIRRCCLLFFHLWGLPYRSIC